MADREDGIGETRFEQLVDIGQDAVLVDESARTCRSAGGETDDLAPDVDAECLAGAVAREGADVDDAAALGPEECPGDEFTEQVARIGGIGEADHVAPLVERHRGVPAGAAQVGQLDHPAIVPHDRMARAEPADRLVALARDADGLAPLVDGRGRAGRVAPIRLQLGDLVPVRLPHDGAELEPDVEVHVAGRIKHLCLGPADHLAPIVDAGGEAMRSTECRQLLHAAILVDEAAAGAIGRRHEPFTAPRFVECIGRIGVGDAHHAAQLVDAGPVRPTMQSAESAEILDLVTPPAHGMLDTVARVGAVAGAHAEQVDAGDAMEIAAEIRGEAGDAIAGHPVSAEIRGDGWSVFCGVICTGGQPEQQN